MTERRIPRTIIPLRVHPGSQALLEYDETRRLRYHFRRRVRPSLAGNGASAQCATQAISLEHNRTRNAPSAVPRSAGSVCLVRGMAKSGTDTTGKLPVQAHLSAHSRCSAHLSHQAGHPVTLARTRPIATQFAGVVYKQAWEHGRDTAPGHPVIRHDPTGLRVAHVPVGAHLREMPSSQPLVVDVEMCGAFTRLRR